MTLRLKTAIVVSLSIAVGVLSLFLFLGRITRFTFSRFEEHRTFEDVRRVVNLVRDDLDQLAGVAADLAARGGVPPPETLARLRLDFAVAVRGGGDLLWSAPPPPAGGAVTPALLREIASGGWLARPAGADGSASGLLALPGGRALVAVRPLPATPAVAGGAGALVVGRWLDAAELGRIGRITLLAVSVAPADPALLPAPLRQVRELLSADEPVAVRPIDGNRMGGHALLADLRGEPALIVSVETPRDLAEEGRITLRYLLAGLVAVGIGIVGVTIAVLERFVLSRVHLLAGQVRRIGADAGLGGGVRVAGSDEVAALGAVINETLAALAKVRAALQEGNENLERNVAARTAELRDALGQKAALLEQLGARVEEIRALEAFKEEIIRNMASGLITFRPDGAATLVNPAARRYLGLAEGEAPGRLEAVVGPPFAAALLAALRGGAGLAEPREIAVAPRDGRERIFGYTVSRMGEGADGTQGIVLFRDLTDAKRLEEEMARLDRLVSLGEVAASLSHELRNPLAAMYSTMQFLARGLAGEPAEMGRVILENMERMEAIIRRMHLLAREAPLARVRLDLGELLGQLLGFLEATFQRERVLVRCDRPPGPVWVDGDPGQLHQALLNLLMNAVQAMPGGGELEVALAPAGTPGAGTAAVSIADSGPGIPPGAAARILDPFFTTKEQGTGLGLPIAHRIVRDHGGTLRFANRPGGGAIFTVELPLAGC